MPVPMSPRLRRLSQVTVITLLVVSPLAAGDSPWYLQGKLGQASVQTDFDAADLGFTFDSTESASTVEVGYSLHRFFDVQAGYRDLGRFDGIPTPCPDGQACPLILTIPVQADVSALSLAAVPRWPVNERFSVFGKLGVLDWDADLSPTFSGPTFESFSGRDLLAGVGAQYVFPKGFGVLLEYETSDLADDVSLGASWRF